MGAGEEDAREKLTMGIGLFSSRYGYSERYRYK